MAYPVGVTTRTISLGPGLILEDGTELAISATVKASADLVWAATGTSLRTVARTIAAGDPGDEPTLVLPITDQEGWIRNGDPLDVTDGNQTHTYTATVVYTDGAGKVVSATTIGPFALPLDDGSPLDIDKLIQAPITTGVQLAIPDAWGQYTADAQAAAVAAAASAAEVAPDATAWPVWAYGNSYAVRVAGWLTTGQHYLDQAAARLGAGAVTSYAVGGRRILDVCSTLINGADLPGTNGVIAAGKWVSTTARNGLVVIESIINDTAHYPTMITPAPAQITAANTRYLDGIKSMYRTTLALVSSESRIEDTAAAVSGTWVNGQVSGTASGGTISYTSEVGAHMTFTVPAPPQTGPLAGKVFVLMYALDPAIGASPCATVNVSVDGGSAVPFAVNSWEQYTGHAGSSTYQVPFVIPVTVPIDGASHTVRVTHAGTAGHFMYADALIVPSSTPNPVAVMGNEHALQVGAFDAAGVAAYRFNMPLVAAAVKAVVAEFGNAFYVPSTMTSGGLYSLDKLHPNDRGQGQRANDLVNAARVAIKARLDSRALALAPDSDFAVL